MADFLLLRSYTTETPGEQVVDDMTSDTIDLTNGFELPPPKPPPPLSLFLDGGIATETLIRATTTTRTTSANAFLNLSSSGSNITIPSSSSSSSLSTSSSSLADVVDKGLIYAPNFPYILENVTLRGLPREIYHWSQSQYLRNGTASMGTIDWDTGLRNSLYSDEGGLITDTAAGLGQPSATIEVSCEDVYVSENGLVYQVIVYCMYILIFVMALLGNGVVCYIVQSSPRMRTVTNYFIANLAIGDILSSLFCVPFSFISILILGYWPFGVILCHLVNYSQAISVLVSAYTLVAISVDRYIVIMWPLRPRITKR